MQSAFGHGRFQTQQERSKSLKKKKNQSSLKAQQRLYIPKLKENESLDLRKTIVQTIMKKQRQHRDFQPLLDQKKFLKYGLCGRRIELKSREEHSFRKTFLPINESDRYQKILHNSKNIQTIQGADFFTFPLKLIKTLEVMRALQTLKLSLMMSQFITFTKILGPLQNLRKLDLSILPSFKKHQSNQIDKIHEKALYKFSEQLNSRKYIRALKLTIPAEDCFKSKEAGANLLNTIGSMNLSCFDVSLLMGDKNIFDTGSIHPRDIQIFFGKIQYLSLGDRDFLEEDLPSQKKLLHLMAKQISNFSDVLAQCHSLQRLDFEAVGVKENFPSSLGNAKGITELKIVFPQIKDSLLIQQASNLISEASNLGFLSIDIPRYEDLEVIQDFLKNSKLKSFHLCLRPSLFLVCEQDKITLKHLCEQIGTIQTLEKFTLDLNFLIDGTPLSSLFAGLPKLKILSVLIHFGWRESKFPFECLGLLRSLEELEIIYPEIQKDEVLSILPEMPSLKNLRIQRRKDTNNEQEMIKMSDYQQKFPSIKL